MLISFCEEFTTKRNLKKIELVKWPCRLYIAAKSLDCFQKVKKNITNKFVKEFVYWPILEKDEGYWISPFSKRSALKRVFSELKGCKVPVMLDLEMPITKNPKLLLTQSINFFSNKRMISRFIETSKNKVYLAEYYPAGKSENYFEKLGLHYKNAAVRKMMYHSMHKFDHDKVFEKLQNGNRQFKDYGTFFGTIAKGIHGTEPILTPEQLREDLMVAALAKIDEAIIYRLGGLNKEYIKVIEEFV